MLNSYKEHQRFLIMNIVNHRGEISRTELAELTGFQLASISAITKQLINDNLLVETGSYSAGHGRKRTLLALNKQHLCAVSISFSTSEVTFIVVQFDGTVIGTYRIHIAETTSEAEMIGQTKQQLLQILGEFNDRNITGIGMCTPANDPVGSPVYSFCSGYLRLSNWLHEVLLPELRQASPIRVNLFTDVTLAIWAEQEFGAAKGVQDFICVELSNGIGCSICCNGKAVPGSTVCAGELGHTVVNQTDDTLCYCGKPDCVEESFALFPLIRSIHRALDHNVTSSLYRIYKRNGKITVDDINRAIDSGDQMCRHYVKKSAHNLGIAIANAAMLLNPKLIILYGSMLKLGDYFIQQLKESIHDNTIKKIRDGFQIIISPNLEDKLPMGAISKIFSLYLKMDDFGWVYQMDSEELETRQ